MINSKIQIEQKIKLRKSTVLLVLTCGWQTWIKNKKVKEMEISAIGITRREKKSDRWISEKTV